MPVVVRIKRRIDEDPAPQSAFVLNGKRRRLENDENDENASGANKEKDVNQVLLKFAGTLDKQDNGATKQFAAARLNKAAAKELVRQTNDPAIATAQRREKQRQEAQQSAREQRYRVVNCLRTTLTDESSAETEAQAAGSSSAPASEQKITIVDIEASHQAQTEPQTLQQPHDQQPADSDIGYVYDLYVPENETQAAYVDLMDDNYLRLYYPFNYYNNCYW
ncbi:uncharacterized protein LOC108597155 isoform X2 [Drosophila busckii]|uniref:uncharacterized protein LOC108597155 isoform X2 n=1 Tax=Drosophila busckii TaxID=30019 RepID=UPI00083E9E41|nr:uncharacterized protein LOC108597155 isoform X2 [Drosophila busckii]